MKKYDIQKKIKIRTKKNFILLLLLGLLISAINENDYCSVICLKSFPICVWVNAQSVKNKYLRLNELLADHIRILDLCFLSVTFTSDALVYVCTLILTCKLVCCMNGK